MEHNSKSSGSYPTCRGGFQPRHARTGEQNPVARKACKRCGEEIKKKKIKEAEKKYNAAWAKKVKDGGNRAKVLDGAIVAVRFLLAS